MAQHPHGTPDPDAPRPPMTGRLRLLLRLTVLSFAANVLETFVRALTGPVALPGTEGLGWMPGLPGQELVVAVTLSGLILTAALYAIVWFALRAQLQWGWVLGLVLSSLGILHGGFDATVLLLEGHVLAALSTLLLMAVNVLWLGVAVRTEVRDALR